MVTVKQYTLPTYKEGYRAILQTRTELMKRYRAGKKLDVEEKDWLDWSDLALDGKIKTASK